MDKRIDDNDDKGCPRTSMKRTPTICLDTVDKVVFPTDKSASYLTDRSYQQLVSKRPTQARHRPLASVNY